MATRSTDTGPSSGAWGEPDDSAFIVLKLRAGWVFDAGMQGLRCRSRRVLLALPAGAELVAAMPLRPSAQGRLSPAERELARFLHLRLPEGHSASRALALARSWPFVERAELPPLSQP